VRHEGRSTQARKCSSSMVVTSPESIRWLRKTRRKQRNSHIKLTLLVFFAKLGFSRNLTLGASSLKFNYNATTPDSTLICLTPELDGEWVFDENKTFLNPVCCESDDRLYRFNKGNCSKERPSNDFSGRHDFLSPMRGRACRCSNFTDRYTWKSNSLPIWNPHDFCRRLNNRTILLVGDSTVSQASTHLMNSVFTAGCQVHMSFMHSDTLIHEQMGALNRGAYWTDAIARKNPDIVVFSSGPHIYGDANYSRVYNSILSDIKILQRIKNITFVWKTNQPGGCTREISKSHPFKAAHEIPEPMFNHDEFFERDSITIQLMQENSIPFIDVRMLYSRSDSHPNTNDDCLHVCSPGPLDIFPILMYRMLKTNFAVPRCIKKIISSKNA